MVVYRPPSSRTNGLTNELFFKEFETFLEHLAAHKDQITVVGDFNFHVDDQNITSAGKLLQLLHTFDYVKHVKQATHKGNHILDLIISRSDDHIVCRRPLVLDLALSDHYAVRCKFLLAKPAFKRKEIAYRNLKRINFDRFREDIINSALMESDTLSLDGLIERYNTTLTSLLNDHAPIRKKVVTLRPANPWFTPEIQMEKVTRRRLERRWRKTRLTVD